MELRKNESIDSSCLLIPFCFIHEQFGYSVESIYRKLHSQSFMHLGTYPQTFPNTITEYFWIQEGSLESTKPWKAFGKMDVHGQSVFFFFTAALKKITADHFLDGKGHMNLWVSVRHEDILEFVMDKETYSTYVSETKSILNQSPSPLEAEEASE